MREEATPAPESVFSPAALDGLARSVEVAFGDGGVSAWHEALVSLAEDDPLHHAAVHLYGLAAFETWIHGGGDPGALYGDSLGVYAAIAASGALDPADGTELVLAAGSAIREAQTELGLRLLAVTGLGREAVADLVAERAGIEITHENSSMQFLVSGPRPELLEIGAEAERRGAFRAGILDLPGVVHRREIGPFIGAFLDMVARVDLVDPVRPLYSCVTAGRATDAGDVRELLAEQLTRPVLFDATVNTISAAGIREHVVLGSCPDLATMLAWIRPDDGIRVFPDAPGDRRG